MCICYSIYYLVCAYIGYYYCYNNYNFSTKMLQKCPLLMTEC